jgi:hypothetical protein
MIYEVYTRFMVGVPLAPGALAQVLERWHRSLDLDAGAPYVTVCDALREAAPRHKQGGADRPRYELALEAFVDTLWDVDCALSGISEGGADAERCQLWVGVRIEQFEHVGRVDVPVQYVRPKVLRKGDLSMGSDLAHTMEGDARKPFDHACRMYRRARLQIEGDAITRTKGLPVSRQHEVGWVMLRWISPGRG